MLLAIDAGNTNIVFAIFDGEENKHVWRLNTNAKRTADEYAAWLFPLFNNADLDFGDIDQAIISSVVPDANYNLDNLTNKFFSCKPVFIGHKLVSTFIDPSLEKPEEIGADRLVNTVAATLKYPYPAIVIDFGTATTFDVVDEKGRYSGGIIAPGANLSMTALHQAAAKLPRVNIEKTDFIKGRSTVEAIQSGIFWGYVSMIEGLIDKLKGELNCSSSVKVIATGGLAALYASSVEAIDHVDDNLTLNGLIHIQKLINENSTVYEMEKAL